MQQYSSDSDEELPHPCLLNEDFETQSQDTESNPSLAVERFSSRSEKVKTKSGDINGIRLDPIPLITEGDLFQSLPEFCEMD